MPLKIVLFWSLLCFVLKNLICKIQDSPFVQGNTLYIDLTLYNLYHLVLMYKTASIITPNAGIVNMNEMNNGLLFRSSVKTGVKCDPLKMGPTEISLHPKCSFVTPRTSH